MIRTATEADLERIVALENLAFDDPWSRTAWQGEFTTGDRDILMWGDDAVITVQTVAEVADLHRIVVDPGARRRGIARALVETSLQRAAARGVARMLLEVATDNAPAQALYRACGFTEITRRANYYAPGVDAVVMVRELEET